MLNKSFFSVVLGATIFLGGCSTESDDKASTKKDDQFEGVVYEEGIHYRKVDGVDSSLDADVTTFFWFQCPHCESLREPLNKWENQNPNITSEKKHSLISESWVNDYMLYEALNKRGIFDEAYNPLFEHIHSNNSGKRTILEILNDAGVEVNEKTFEFTDLEKKEMSENAKKTKDIEKSIGAMGVPYMVVKGEYLLLNKSFSSYEEMLDAAEWVVENAP